MAPQRDLVGYGERPPNPQWPGNARLALQIVLNYEEGAERSLENGDSETESLSHELAPSPPLANTREVRVESLYDYGSRVGFWRLMNLFRERRIPISVFAVAMALEKNPDAARAIVAAGHEVVSHGWRWIDYQFADEALERDHIRRAISSLQEMTGVRPQGWYTGRCSPNTRRLIIEEGGFLYDSDSYSDDLPYWTEVEGKPHLVIPYSFDNNDGKFHGTAGFSTGADFFEYLKDSFDTLYAEGATTPRMMSVGLHARIAGRPGRFQALVRFLNHVMSHDDVWICRRIDIAEHWRRLHPFQARAAA